MVRRRLGRPHFGGLIVGAVFAILGLVSNSSAWADSSATAYFAAGNPYDTYYIYAPDIAVNVAVDGYGYFVYHNNTSGSVNYDLHWTVQVTKYAGDTPATESGDVTGSLAIGADYYWTRHKWVSYDQIQGSYTASVLATYSDNNNPGVQGPSDSDNFVYVIYGPYF